jgi:hypothetical protein
VWLLDQLLLWYLELVPCLLWNSWVSNVGWLEGVVLTWEWVWCMLIVERMLAGVGIFVWHMNWVGIGVLENLAL